MAMLVLLPIICLQVKQALGPEGVAYVAFINNTLYAVLAGGGCSHGVPSIPNGIIKVLPNKK